MKTRRTAKKPPDGAMNSLFHQRSAQNFRAAELLAYYATFDAA
ncbi:MAG: hypothetical protein ACOVSW_10265 [Candidatus Kapaibacteriota bacterium]